MFTLEEFNGHRVSFEKEELSLNIDIWDSEYVFSAQFGAELYMLWKTYQSKPTGEPTRSRVNTSVGVGETPDRPTVIKAEFVCVEDLEDYEKQARKALTKKETYISLKELKANSEKAEAEARAEREKALKK